ncbi:MAG: DUF177 domain-containing protein [Acetobacteraceae bacterium]|nr:DUF177 domain-containing protein [Acetobacteraceae bacterium]
MTPELHRPVPADQIASQGEEMIVEASAAECAALALRFGLPEVVSLRCRFRLSPASGGAVAALGHLRARVVQVCVVTLEPFEALVEERFSVRFVPEGTETDLIDPEAEDEIPYANGILDLGEASAEQLALALDPYPRKSPDSLPSGEGEHAPHTTRPFAQLSERLRRH